jgi:hypothetical protein
MYIVKYKESSWVDEIQLKFLTIFCTYVVR